MKGRMRIVLLLLGAACQPAAGPTPEAVAIGGAVPGTTPPEALATAEAPSDAAQSPTSLAAHTSTTPSTLEIPGGGPDPLLATANDSTSVGTPVEGRLEGSIPLPLHGPGYRFNPAKDPAGRHGTVEMVQALVRAAAVVEAELPGNTLTIGELSRPTGGDIPGHASHRSGRDVDIMFYLQDADGTPMQGKAIPIEPDGTGVDYGDLGDAADDVPVRIDVPRTWRLLQALVGDPQADINRIFVVEHVRRMLLDEAERVDAPREIARRFADLTCQPGFPHDDHIHIRFFCSIDDIAAGCEDTEPVYPWHAEKLARAGTKAALAGSRKTPRPALTSVAAAERKAAEQHGEFHPDVTAFLERRRAWAKRPHPGRPYCR